MNPHRDGRERPDEGATRVVHPGSLSAIAQRINKRPVIRPWLRWTRHLKLWSRFAHDDLIDLERGKNSPLGDVQAIRTSWILIRDIIGRISRWHRPRDSVFASNEQIWRATVLTAEVRLPVMAKVTEPAKRRNDYRRIALFVSTVDAEHEVGQSTACRYRRTRDSRSNSSLARLIRLGRVRTT